MTNFLRRATNFSSGISAGGGDTGWGVIGQRTILTVPMKNTAKTVYLPAGTILIATVKMPDATNPSTTGDYGIERVTGGANTELSAAAAETPSITLYSPAKQIAVHTEYTITPTNSPDGTTHVGFEVILPKIRT